jgi:hypothetical protein
MASSLVPTRAAVVGQVVGITSRSGPDLRSLILVDVGLTDIVAFTGPPIITVNHGDYVAAARRPIDWSGAARDERWIAMFPRLVLLAQEDFYDTGTNVYVIDEQRSVGEPFDPYSLPAEVAKSDVLVVASTLLGLSQDG